MISKILRKKTVSSSVLVHNLGSSLSIHPRFGIKGIQFLLLHIYLPAGDSTTHIEALFITENMLAGLFDTQLTEASGLLASQRTPNRILLDIKHTCVNMAHLTTNFTSFYLFKFYRNNAIFKGVQNNFFLVNNLLSLLLFHN